MSDIVDVGALDRRDIPGWEGLYAVTSDGRVWAYPRAWISANGSRHSHAGMWLRNDDSGPYLRVTLQNATTKSRQSVHRLVALAWIPNPERWPEVNHKDGVKRNNAAENLEWCSKAHNMQHSFLIGLRPVTDRQRSARRKNAMMNIAHRKFDSAQVAEIKRLHKAGASANSIGKNFGVRHSTICRIVKGESYAD